MLAVHWTPVANTKHILKNGIRKSKKGLYCFPLTGHRQLDKWWVSFFNQCCRQRGRKKYNGIVFRIRKDDLPACFYHWAGATGKDDFQKPFTTLKALTSEYRDTILRRLGEQVAFAKGINQHLDDVQKMDEMFYRLAAQEIANGKHTLQEYIDSVEAMTFALEDYQIVLSQSISPDRIIKVLPQGSEFGKIIRKRKLDRG